MRVRPTRAQVEGVRRSAQKLARRTVSVSYRSIVVPLLGRAETAHALDLACRLAGARGSTVLLVAPLIVPNELPLDAHFDDEVAELERQLAEAAEIAKAHGVGAKPRVIRTRAGALGRELAAFAHDYRAQLLVVGAPVESRRGFRRPFPQDVFTIVRDAPCRVLIVSGRVVPAAGEAFVLRRILVPVKLGPIGTEMLMSAIRLAAEQNATVEVLCVLPVPLDVPVDTELPELEERAAAALAEAALLGAGQGVEVLGHIVRARSIGSAIADVARETHADLIVLGSSPRWRREPRFFSPTVEYVLRHAPTEVMVVAFPEGALGATLGPR